MNSVSLNIRRELFAAGERLCVAISGGADSVALLLALVEANTASPQNKQPLGVGLSAVHVHHGLRGAEADDDEAFVRELCGGLQVPLHVERVDTAARLSEKPGEHAEGLEQAARVLRYEVFAKLMESDADVIATAHTLDDQAETVMMKLLRGAWTEGLGGIAGSLRLQGVGRQSGVGRLKGASRGVDAEGVAGPSTAFAAGASHFAQDDRADGSGRIVRPMLGVRRAEVEAFLRSREQAWREDSSNEDTALTRNRVRHELFPLLRTYNPQVAEMLANVSELARDDEAFWQAEVARVLPQVLLPGKPVRGGGRAVGTAVGEQAFALELERLRSMPAALRSRVVRAAARQMGVRLSFDDTARVLAVAGFGQQAALGKEGGKVPPRAQLRSGLCVERSARELRLWRTERNAPVTKA